MDAFYKDPVERERWGRVQSEIGLYPTEKKLIEEHFPRPARILNIGSGGGREAFALAGLGFRVAAVDLEPEFVGLTASGAKTRGLEIESRVMDATALDFDDGSFDAIVMVGQLIGHICPRDRRVAALAEAARVTRADGVGLFSTNAIELGLRYRAYFALSNLARKVYNPHGLEPDDAFVFRQGGKRRPLLAAGGAVFHWYRVPEFQADLARAGWKPRTWLRRIDFEGKSALAGSAFGGETFHIAFK